eukprot:10349513-Lingulodinium_polyedra.AAC.1
MLGSASGVRPPLTVSHAFRGGGTKIAGCRTTEGNTGGAAGAGGMLELLLSPWLPSPTGGLVLARETN